MLTRDTLLLLNEMLNSGSIPVGHPEFEREALRFAAAKKELREALEAVTDDPDADA